MKEFYLKTGEIPSNINLDEILGGLEGNVTRIRHLKNGIEYFLSLLTINNYVKTKSKDGFRPLNSEILSRIIGKPRSSEVIKILKSKNVIETIPHIKGRSSRKYRLSEKYNTGSFVKVEFGERIKNQLTIYKDSKVESDEDLLETGKYSHIFSQFQKNRLDFDGEKVDIFIKNLGSQLLNKSLTLKLNKDLSTKSLFNYIGRMSKIVNDFREQIFHPSVSESNMRFHSGLTSLPKIIRPFLTINREKIGEIDLSSSQLYILSTILNEDFLIKDGIGYNLHTIFEELKKELRNLKKIITSNQVGNPHYVLGVHLNENNYQGLGKFTQVDFRDDFYMYILNEGIRLYPEYLNSKKGFRGGREYIKKQIMNFLFESNDDFREKNDVIILIKRLSSGLCEYIEQFNQHYTNTQFSYLLQRTESFLVLENVCKVLHLDHPSVPFYTIHDSIITTQSNIDLVQSITFDTITKITKKPVGVKSKIFEPSDVVPEDVVDRTWKKVLITSRKQYERKKSYFLQNNIKVGIDLIIEEERRDFFYNKYLVS